MGSFLQGKDFTKRPLDFDQGMDSLALSMVSSPKSKLTAFNTPIPIEKLMEVESPMPDIILESLEDLKKDEVILSQELIQLEKALIKMKPLVPSNNKSQSGLERKKTPNPSTSYSNLKLWKQQKQIERELDVDKEIENTEKVLGYDDFFADSFHIKNTIKPPPIPIPLKKFDLKVTPVDSKLRVRTEESKSRAINIPSRSPEISKRGKIKRENNDPQGLNISKEQKSSKEENKSTSLGKTIIPYGYYNYSNLMPNKSDRAAGKIIQISRSQILQNIQDSSNQTKTVDSLNVTETKSSPLIDKDKMGGFINPSRGKNPIKERNPEQKSNGSQRIKTENNSARGNSSQIRERQNAFESLAQENSELYKDIEVLTTTNNKSIFRNLLNQAGFGIFPSSPTIPNKSTVKVSQSYNFAESSFANKEIVLNLDLSLANIRSGGQLSLRSRQDSTRDKKPKVPNFNEYKMRDVHGRKFVLRDKTNDENVNKSVQLLRNGGVEEEKLVGVGKRLRHSEKLDQQEEGKSVVSEINFQKLKNPQSLFRKKAN